MYQNNINAHETSFYHRTKHDVNWTAIRTSDDNASENLFSLRRFRLGTDFCINYKTPTEETTKTRKEEETANR